MMVQLFPFFPDLPEEGQETLLTLACETDTSAPRTMVPVFLIHSLDHPFCGNLHCVCQADIASKNAMLFSIRRGEAIVYASTHFQDTAERGQR